MIQRIMNIAFGVPVSFTRYPWYGMILFTCELIVPAIINKKRKTVIVLGISFMAILFNDKKCFHHQTYPAIDLKFYLLAGRRI